MNMQTDSKQSERPARFAPTGGYATAVWLLECGAEDRDKTAEKLRDWADERGDEKDTRCE